jgi:hypothetical protein
VRLTTYHLHVPMSRNLGDLTSWNPVGLFRPGMGQLCFYMEQTDVHTFLILSRSILLRMKNVADKSCRGNQNTHFVFTNFFLFKNRAVYETMCKNTVE